MSSYEWPPTGSGAGTVTSIALADGSSTPIYDISGSPITSNGTLTFTLKTELANLVFAGPTTGSAAQPTFRSLVSADLPFAITNITDVGTDGITITNGTGAVIGASPVTVAQHVADTTHNGYLSSTDWNTFNGKQAALTIGNLTDAGTDGITVTGGTGSVIGSGTSIAQHVADGTHNGYLSSSDWTAFNGKQSALTIGNLTDAGTDGITVTSGTGAVIGSGTSIAQHVADASHNGYLSSTDWSTFNGKGAGSVTSVTFTGDGTVLSSTPSSAVTTTGTVTAALATQAKNLVLAGPASGSNAAPTFRALVNADMPTIRSQVTLNGDNGNGSTNTAIRRYTTTTTNTGSDMTYADSATNGMSVTIVTAGLYAISVQMGSNTSRTVTGISVNSNQLTTDIASITAANALAFSSQNFSAGNTEILTASWTGLLNANDVIRSHDFNYTSSTASNSKFNIVKIGN